MKIVQGLVVPCVLAGLGLPVVAAPQGSGFAFQGQIKQQGIPVNGVCDFQFSLWDDPAGNVPANQIGVMQTLAGIVIKNGLIAVELNAGAQFGPNAFSGDARWLAISARCPAGNGNYTPLLPRQRISSAPYSLHAFNALSGDSVWSLNGASAYYTAGNVGIGTTTPGRLLQLGSSTIPNSEGMIRLASRSGTNGANRIWDIGVPETDAETGGTGYSFVIDDTLNGPDPELLIRWDTGNVGIGTSNPTSKLEVGSSLLIGTAIRGIGTMGVYGEGGDAGVRGYGPATRSGNGIALHGIAQATVDDFFGTYFGGIGVKGESPSNVGVLGTSTQSCGVRGESQNNDGVHGLTHHAARSGVWGHNDGGGYGVAGSTTGTGYAGVYGTGPVNGVFGETGSGSDSGVYGQNNGYGSGVAGYAAGGPGSEGPFSGTGVVGTSDGAYGTGVVGRGHGYSGVGVFGEAQNGPGAVAIVGSNPGGRAGYFDGSVKIEGPAEVYVLTVTGGADLAEPFDITAGVDGAGAISPGMIVVIDPEREGRLKLANVAYDRKVAGIISGAKGLAPGMVMKASGNPLAQGEHAVALTGRVWCYCDAVSSAIEPGDLLTTSDRPGHAMKALDLVRAQGAILGKAMTRLPHGEAGLVLVLVNLQ